MHHASAILRRLLVKAAWTGLVVAAFSGAAHAEAPSAGGARWLEAVEVGRAVACLKPCRVVKLVDGDRRAGRVRDAFGGSRATDGHAGIDIAVDSMSATASVLVLSVAPGRVVAVRDGMPDRDAGSAPRWWYAGRQAGNLVVIDHGGGLRTAYVHLALGSVSVRQGDRVERGQVLGRPGMSGYAAFPHVEVRFARDGRTVDPVAEGLVTLARLVGRP